MGTEGSVAFMFKRLGYSATLMPLLMKSVSQRQQLMLVLKM